MSAQGYDIDADTATLRVYALGAVDFDALVGLQRRLHFEVAHERRPPALVLCEHLPLITVGRRGSRCHITLEEDELTLRGWPIRWVGRGGGCVLHGPGQLAVYPILPLKRFRLAVGGYVQQLSSVIRDLVTDFSIHGQPRTSEAGVWVGARLLAAVGVAVRNWTTLYGAYMNVGPALAPYRFVMPTADAGLPMTSLERERRGKVQPALVRQRLIEHFRQRFGFARCEFFSDHPALPRSRGSERADAVPLRTP